MKEASSFRSIQQISYSLMGFIPYLLAVYLIIHENIELKPEILLLAAGALIAHLIGLFIVNGFARQLNEVLDKTAKAISSDRKLAIDLDRNAPEELISIVNNFNFLLSESEKSSRNFQEMATKMMLYSAEIEKYQNELKDEALSRQRLSRYVGQDLVNKIINSNEDVPLANKQQVVTALFADIRSFTTLSEHMEPEVLISMLNEYFDAMVKIVFKHDGVLDKFVGDELMAIFGILGRPEDGPVNAMKASIAMQEIMQELMQGFVLKGYPSFQIGVGINTGMVVMGNVGSKNRMDYTVIGDTVNVAARLEQMAEGQTILIGEETFSHCHPHFRMEAKGEVAVRNRSKPVQYYQVIHRKADQDL